MDYKDFLDKAYWLIENNYYTNICPFKLADILEERHKHDQPKETIENDSL